MSLLLFVEIPISARLFVFVEHLHKTAGFWVVFDAGWYPFSASRTLEFFLEFAVMETIAAYPKLMTALLKGYP
jgi:hypothetical protein